MLYQSRTAPLEFVSPFDSLEAESFIDTLRESVSALVKLNGVAGNEAICRKSALFTVVPLPSVCLGRAYLAAAQYAQADSEFERCLKRRGEALQLILGDEPTYAYVPPVYYYQGQVREGMKVEGAADSYREYLRFRGNSTEDPVLTRIRARLAP